MKSAGPPSRSASPAVRRGASSRGKKPVLLPTNAGRRSKEEREARNAADLQRERERNKERDALAAKKQKAAEAAERREKMRTEGRGRGGHSGVSSFFGGHRPGKFSSIVYQVCSNRKQIAEDLAQAVLAAALALVHEKCASRTKTEARDRA